MSDPSRPRAAGFAGSRAEALAREAESWDTSKLVPATLDDVPVIDIGRYLTTNDTGELESLGNQVRYVGENVGFHFLTGHGIDEGLFEAMFQAAAAFLTLPEDEKLPIVMDSPDAAVPGVGWLPPGERRLPERAKGNLNEAILFKQDRAHRLADNPWPSEALVPGFRAVVESYADAIESLALRLVPIYAVALGLDADYFDDAFESPFYRLRMSRYQRVAETDVDEYGIAPHVDTTFFTLLAQSGPGLAIYGELKKAWLEVPVVPGALVVNTGELLKQWSNDRFLSVKHFVPPHSQDEDRYSIPFFFNATADYPMECLPTCHGPDNPPKYPTISYLESQAAAQRE